MGKRSPFFPGANKRLWRELFTNKYTDSSVNFTQKIQLTRINRWHVIGLGAVFLQT